MVGLNIMKIFAALIALTLFLVPMQVQAGSSYEYQLYKNHENYGIVIFPKKFIQKDIVTDRIDRDVTRELRAAIDLVARRPSR